MDKELLKSKEQFDCFVKSNIGYNSYFGDVVSWLKKPEKYPCVLMWYIEDDSNGPAHMDGDYVYLEDFEL